ncbi:hypothetical protein BS50DRAFT_211283 [Corynespora cassiicola Philippines]|uniref:Uncharacterized protein n=1 Tax=Corynespora cassiicola Philippines TaxID=1448308 RepID=A0A2T2N416_CORCC|nr:hypothetical protein BS50DRAFT_211283 [Corynespora cassiicola Philippines]
MMSQVFAPLDSGPRSRAVSASTRALPKVHGVAAHGTERIPVLAGPVRTLETSSAPAPIHRAPSSTIQWSKSKRPVSPSVRLSHDTSPSHPSPLYPRPYSPHRRRAPGYNPAAGAPPFPVRPRRAVRLRARRVRLAGRCWVRVRTCGVPEWVACI